jgi:hypothetical protein
MVAIWPSIKQCIGVLADTGSGESQVKYSVRNS